MAFRPGLWPTLTVLVALPILVMLGTWQVDRLAWKTDLIATLEARYAAAPVPLPSAGEIDAAWAHRPVRATVTLAAVPALRFGVERQQGRPGYDVLQLGLLEDGRALVVNRGWLAEDAPPPITPDGVVTLTGPLRWIGDLKQRWPTPANDAAGNRWYWYEEAALERMFARDVLPVVLEVSDGALSPGAAVPVPQPMAVHLPNNHLGYALTWYGLAAALVIIYAAYGRQRGREER